MPSCFIHCFFVEVVGSAWTNGPMKSSTVRPGQYYATLVLHNNVLYIGGRSKLFTARIDDLATVRQHFLEHITLSCSCTVSVGETHENTMSDVCGITVPAPVPFHSLLQSSSPRIRKNYAPIWRYDLANEGSRRSATVSVFPLLLYTTCLNATRTSQQRCCQ